MIETVANWDCGVRNLPKDDAGHVIANRFGGRADFNSPNGNVAEALRADPSLVTTKTPEGDAPLHLACWQKQIAIIGTIVAYRPDLNARGCYGRTPLHYAVHEGRAISVPIIGIGILLEAD